MVVEARRDEELEDPRAKYRGRWVAIKAGRIVVTGETPTDVLREIKERRITGWVLDRIPEDPDSLFDL